MICKPRIFMLVEQYHYFKEFFEPLFESIGETVDIILIINNLNQQHTDKILFCSKELSNIKEIKIVKLYGAGLINSFFSVLGLLKYTKLGGIWCFPFLSDPAIRILSEKIAFGGGKSILVQSASLHYSVWEQKLKPAEIIKPEHFSKFLRFKKYPNYMRYIYRRFKRMFDLIFFGLLISPLINGKFFFKTKSMKFNYLVNSSDIAMVFSENEKKIFQRVYGSPKINVVRTPSYNKGINHDKNGLLIALPGPFKNSIPASLNEYFDVVNSVIIKQNPKVIMIRSHPGESEKIKKYVIDLVRSKFKDLQIEDVTEKPIFSVLDRTKILISRPSTLLVLSRNYSKYIAIIGVLNSGFDGILATNAQFSDIPDINWVEKPEDIDFDFINQKCFVIEKNVRKDLASELVALAFKYQSKSLEI